MASDPEESTEQIWNLEPDAHPESPQEQSHRRLTQREVPPERPDSPEQDTVSVFEALERIERRMKPNERYRVLEEVARGGQGTILRVWDEDLRRHLAMKLILRGETNSSGSGESKSLGRFLDEAQVTGRLDHPGIVPVHELGLDAEGRVYFTMKFVRGKDLRAIFKSVRAGRDGWTKLRALGVLLKVCDALSYAHDKGVIHRDLKPGNIMVGKYGEVLVMDWGLARILGEPDRHDLRIRRHSDEDSVPLSATEIFKRAHVDDDSPLETMDGDVVGTPAYMPPEQAAGNIDAMGPHSDVYSVGAILYELISGQRPYVPRGVRVNSYAIWALVQTRAPASLEQIAPDASPELVAICEKAMARDPANRYPSTAELSKDLAAFLEGRVVRAFETGVFAELRKWVVRNRTAAGAIGLFLVTLIAGLGIVAYLLAERAKQSEQILLSLEFPKLDMLKRQVAEYWPVQPAHIPKYEAWLESAQGLIERHQSFGPSQYDGQAPEVMTLFDRYREEMNTFGDPKVGLLRGTTPAFGWGIEKRLELARTIEERSVSGRRARQLWDEAKSGISANPLYGSLDVRPQLGLLPIGPDPKSKLWEFWHILSGEEPRRGADGTIALHEKIGIVLVLLPGGFFSMGAQNEDELADNFDPLAGLAEQPVREVQLRPFFISKYEMTQHQWMLLTSSNPSAYVPEIINKDWKQVRGFAHNLRHPVERISWEDCDRVLAWIGLSLPTEAQWEYAARAGTSTPWWPGNDEKNLQSVANISDLFAHKYMKGWVDPVAWDDGFCFSAEVGTFDPNPFGLHEVHGNIMEWVYDGWDPQAYEKRGNFDPVVPPATCDERVARGGDFNDSIDLIRSAFRSGGSPDYTSARVGVRPAMILDN